MGPNGSGKTTLLRILLGEEEPDAGTVQRGHLVEFGYYDQHLQVAAGRQAGDPGRLAGRRPRRRPSRRCATCSGRFGLAGDQVYQQVGELSGGERSRAALAQAGGAGRQRAGARRADEPPRPLGVRRAGAGAAGVRGHGDRRQPRPLLPQPRRRPADRPRRRRATCR